MSRSQALVRAPSGYPRSRSTRGSEPAKGSSTPHNSPTENECPPRWEAGTSSFHSAPTGCATRCERKDAPGAVAGCGDRDWPREIPGLCPAQRPAGHHLLAFGNKVFDRNAKASEGVAHLGHPAFKVCLRVSRGLDRIMVEVAGGAKLLKNSETSLIPHLLKDTA